MVLIKYLIQADFFVLLTIIYLLLFMRSNDAFDHELNVHVKYAMCMLVGLAFFDTMDVVLGAAEKVSPLRAFFVGGGFIIRPFLLMSVLMFFKQYQYSPKEGLRMLLPAILNTVIILTAFFHPYVFVIDENNVLQRHVLSYAPHVISIYYLVYAIVWSEKQKRSGFADDALMMRVSLAAVLIAVGIEIRFSMRGTLCGVVGLIIAFYYLYRHMDNSRRDSLTGASNRASFFADLSKMRPDQMTAFCEFDMNNLKDINDRQGHQEGDRAIIEMFRIIQDCLPYQSRAYRFGGDEFAVLFYDVNMSTVHSTIYKIRQEFEKCEYGCAIGVAEWKEKETFRDVYNRADEAMYEDKKRQKEKMGQSAEVR